MPREERRREEAASSGNSRLRPSRLECHSCDGLFLYSRRVTICYYTITYKSSRGYNGGSWRLRKEMPETK
ncbi:hypothetical protein KSP39_PZI007343 [Platanthera zijinensis]|uniref:Uncharacterized protein n=1 Tax=Platanthera zijinensis TaxID=2320716 RepID=A0AAP0BQQ7_9ASPA